MGPPAIACLLVLFLVVFPSVAWAQGSGGVTVINVPPEFRDIDIGTRDGLHHIDLVVSDYNSWEDILRVDLEILDESREPVAHVIFQPYENATVAWDPVFIENLGEVLVRDQSLASVNLDPKTIAERSELRVTFAILPLLGRWLRITAVDLEGLMATAQVEYLTGAVGGTASLPPLVLLLLAVAASVILVGSRVRREMHGG